MDDAMWLDTSVTMKFVGKGCFGQTGTLLKTKREEEWKSD